MVQGDYRFGNPLSLGYVARRVSTCSKAEAAETERKL